MLWILWGQIQRYCKTCLCNRVICGGFNRFCYDVYAQTVGRQLRFCIMCRSHRLRKRLGTIYRRGKEPSICMLWNFRSFKNDFRPFCVSLFHAYPHYAKNVMLSSNSRWRLVLKTHPYHRYIHNLFLRSY